MNRRELEAYICDTYKIPGEQPWARYPTYTVFRHAGNRKWFAVLMDVPREKLGSSGKGAVSVVNLKCDPRLIGAFREEPGIFPGYHMNKDHWLTVALDGTVGEEKLRFLTELSYSLTKGGKRETTQEVLP